MRDTTRELKLWLESGGRKIGQIAISPKGTGWELRHEADAALASLAVHEGPAAARSLANLDDSGAYRPLKTAPNLRRGWVLFARDVIEMRKALEAFYPAMLGVWLAKRMDELVPADLRETLGRQTGMYRVTQKISDEQAQAVIAKTCEPRNGCIKSILWQIAPGLPISSLPAEKFQAPADGSLPLWCHEGCNILVANARKIVKGEAE